MADFAAVLKKTIDAQANPTPELRQRVYAKARATIEQKLVTANAPESVALRQRKILEDAIEEVENFYAPPAPVTEHETEGAIDPLSDFLDEVTASDVPTDSHLDMRADKQADMQSDMKGAQNQETAADAGLNNENFNKEPKAERPYLADKKKTSSTSNTSSKGWLKPAIIALVALVVLGGGAFLFYENKDKLNDIASTVGREEAPQTSEETAEAPATTPETEPDVAEPAAEPKLTQRLMPDGTETDPGPAGGEANIGEGKSTAAITSNSGSTNSPAETNTPAEVAAVAQQALFYEERSAQDAESVSKGTVVWSVIQDSPGEGEPEEPAVRAEVTLPDSNLRLNMTVRRNTDETIPASHLFELMFIVPDNFKGGAIDNVQRITFKQTEQANGNPLIAVPFKVADNFFIVALNDARTAVETNMALMRRLQWIDIPVTYRTGRRALISFEKGIPGDKAFDEVIKSWEPAENSN